MRRGRQEFRRFCVVGLIVALSGCGEKPQPGGLGPGAPPAPGLVPIKGTLTIDGKATQGVKVIFLTAEAIKGAKKDVPVYGPSGITDDKGEFTITSTHINDGVPPGEYSVVFDWTPPEFAAYFDDPDVTIPPAISKSFPPNLMAFRQRHKVGGAGVQTVKITNEKSPAEVKFDLTSK